MRLLKALESKLGLYRARPPEYEFRCPQCDDQGFHLGVNLKLQLFNCFRCSFKGSLSYLLRYLGLDSQDYDLESQPRVEKKEWRPPEGWKPPSMPLCDGWTKFRGTMFPTGIGKYEGYVLIPFTLGGHYFIAYSLGEKTPKILNPPKAEGWPPSSYVVYNLPWAVTGGYGKNIVITEGIFDAVAIDKVQGYRGVAILGKHMSNTQYNRIISTKPGVVIVFLDRDAVPQARKIYNRFRRKVDTRLILWEKTWPGDDPDELPTSILEGILKIGTPKEV